MNSTKRKLPDTFTLSRPLALTLTVRTSHTLLFVCVCFSEQRKHTSMACLQRKQHLDFLEIHSVRDVLVNKRRLFAPDLFCKKLFIRLLYCLFGHVFCSPTLKAVEIRVFWYCCLFPLQSVSHFTLNKLWAHSSNSDVRCCRSLSEERAFVSHLLTACRAALMSVV